MIKFASSCEGDDLVHSDTYLSTENHYITSRYFSVRDAEMTIKMLLERSSQKGGRQGGSKRGSIGDPS